MFSLEATFNTNKVHQYIERQIEERVSEVVDFLYAKGIEYTTFARDKVFATNPYTNRTFNLVSSVGFAIVRKGEQLKSYFPLLQTGSEGKKKGEDTAERAAKELSGTDDITLVLVAGADYASYVQAKEYDVIAGASDEFEAFINQKWRVFK